MGGVTSRYILIFHKTVRFSALPLIYSLVPRLFVSWGCALTIGLDIFQQLTSDCLFFGIPWTAYTVAGFKCKGNCSLLDINLCTFVDKGCSFIEVFLCRVPTRDSELKVYQLREMLNAVVLKSLTTKAPSWKTLNFLFWWDLNKQTSANVNGKEKTRWGLGPRKLIISEGEPQKLALYFFHSVSVPTNHQDFTQKQTRGSPCAD